MLVAQSRLNLCDPMDCSPPGFSVRGDSPGNDTRVGSHSLLQDRCDKDSKNVGVMHM